MDNNTTDTYKDKLWIIDTNNTIPTEDYSGDQHVTIIFCKSGWIKGFYDFNHIEIGKSDICVFTPNHSFSFTQHSDDFKCYIIVIHNEFATSLRESNSTKAQMHFTQHGFIHLEEQEFETFIHAIETLRYILRSDIEDKDSTVRMIFTVLFRIFNSTESVRDIAHAQQNHQEYVFERFIETIVRYHKQSREVIFYANKMCLSPKYLSSIIKKVSGLTANNWINQYVIKEAKTILKTKKELTIQEISLLMGFSDQSSFSRYFKKHVGCTPNEYRISYK